MTDSYPMSSFNAGELSSKGFLSKLAFVAVPVIVGGLLIAKDKSWYQSHIVQPTWAASLMTQIVVWVVIAIVLAWVWYKLSLTPYANVAHGVFVGILAISFFYVFVLFCQHELAFAKYLLLALTLYTATATAGVWVLHRTAGILMALTTAWFAYLTAAAFKSYQA